MERNWGRDLPREIILKLAEEHVESYEDFETLRWVCSHWRSVAKEANFAPPSLIIPEENLELYKSFRLYNVSKSKVNHIQLPDAKIINNYSCSKLMTSTAGWMLLFAEGKVKLRRCFSRKTHLFLFNPSSRAAVIQLPPVDRLSCGSPRPFHWEHFNKFVLSANPSNTSDFAVFLNLRLGCNDSDTASVIWRNGDDSWTPVEESTDYSPAVCYYSGAFYKIHRCGTLMKVEPNGRVQERCRVPLLYDTPNYNMHWVYYLVELNGQLVCLRRVYDYWCRTTLRFDLFRFNLINDQVEEIQNLGDRAIFVDSNSCFSRRVDGFHFKANCIYYTNDAYSDINGMCVYDLANGEVRGLYNGPSIPYRPSMFMWVQCCSSLGNLFDVV